MKQCTTIGIDLAKSVFQIAQLNRHQILKFNRQFSRLKMVAFMSQQPPCLVGLEACGSAHYWAGVFTQMGHTVKLLPPAYVKGFVYGNKNDRNDAKAIATAAAQHNSPTVKVKSQEQLALQALLRIRERRIKQRTACSNQLRGLLSEQGVIYPKGYCSIRRIDLQAIPEVIRDHISALLGEFKQHDQWIKQSQASVTKLAKAYPTGQALLALPGFGVMNTLASLVNNPSDYKNGRHYSAYLGCVPKQTGTGGNVRIKGLSKRGNKYQRYLLCHGARAFLSKSKDYDNPLLIWAKRIEAKKGKKVAVGALANKMARISWHILNGETYDPAKTAQTMNS